MANITALNIGGSQYDIVAASAAKLSAARNIAATGDVTWSVSFDGSQAKTGNATINNVPSAISWSGVSAEVDKSIGSKIGGVYKAKGTKTVAQINALTDMTPGDVYNVSDSGTINGQTVLAGDNVVYVSASTTDKGWDKLAATIDTSNFALKNGTYTGTDGMKVYSAVNAGNAAKASDSDKLGGTAAASYALKTGSYTASTEMKVYSAVNAGNAAQLGGVAAATVTGNAASGAAASAWISTNGTNISNSAKSGYAASSWISTNGTNISNSANSGAVASAYIKNNESKWTSGEANQNAYSTIKIYPTKGASGQQTNASSKQDVFGFSASDNISMTATSDGNGNPIIAISAKDTNTTYDANNFVTATHLSNIQTASGYAADWNTNKAGVMGSANSGKAAYDLITANSASWTADKDTKYSLSAGDGLSANYVAAGSTTGLLVKGVQATSAALGVTKASYVENNIAYIF